MEQVSVGGAETEAEEKASHRKHQWAGEHRSTGHNKHKKLQKNKPKNSSLHLSHY